MSLRAPRERAPGSRGSRGPASSGRAGASRDATASRTLASVALACALALLGACASDANHERPPLAGFVWPMKGAIAEGVAFDPVTRDFFVSSVRERRIWRVTPDGEFHDFFGPDDRMFGAFGLCVDEPRRQLCVATSRVPQSDGFAPGQGREAGVLVLSLRDAHVDACVYLHGAGEHVFGDVVRTADGAVWVTDSKTPALYRAAPGADFVAVRWGNGWRNPQGLAFSEHGELFVADYPRGIARVDPVAGSHFILPGSEERLRGVDGLYWHDGALYAIQNGTRTHRVLRVVLDASRSAVERIDVLLEGPPLDDPTLGVFAEGAFFVNAASGWSDYTDTGERTARPPTEHRLVRIPLEPQR